MTDQSQQLIKQAASLRKTYQLRKNWAGHNMETFFGRLKYWGEVSDIRKSFHSTATLKAY